MEISKQETPLKTQDNAQGAQPDPTTQESIKQGETVIKIQEQLNTDPEDKKKADAAKDAENWRNEG